MCRMGAKERGGFNPCFDGLWVGTREHPTQKALSLSFNPCFDGLWVGTPFFFSRLCCFHSRFNPCFDGLWVGTCIMRDGFMGGNPVSILVLMDCGLGLNRGPM